MAKKKKAKPKLPPPMLTSQPLDWQAAFKAQADAEGKKLSIWVGERCKAGLPAEVRKSLSPRVQGRPKKNPE